MAIEDETTGEASPGLSNKDKAAEASNAIVLKVTQSSTASLSGQPLEGELVATGSIAEPMSTKPVSIQDGKNCDEDTAWRFYTA